LSSDLLLQLPHRQFVWTILRCLRVFLKHNRTIHAELSRLIFTLLADYISEAAGRKIATGMVSSLQTFGEFAGWNPHWHPSPKQISAVSAASEDGYSCIHDLIGRFGEGLEGGFDRYDKFFFIPIGASDEFAQLWRVRVVEFFVRQKLIDTEFAKSLLGWKHSGFSIESGTRIYDDRAREALSQYIVRAPVSLEKITWDSRTDTVTWKAPRTGPHKGKERYFDGLDFIAQLTLHIPEKGKHLLRRYGVYSSRSRGTWRDRPGLRNRAPENWYGFSTVPRTVDNREGEAEEVTKVASRKAWARLLAKVYEIDVLRCPECGGRMSVIAVIREPESIRRIIDCMGKQGRGPPALASTSRN
jgi:hypothetical protein